jgi:hypothetical protein
MQEYTINFLNDREPLVIKGETFIAAVEEYIRERQDLRYADLTGANLYCANLQDAYLTGANLHGADLSFSNLTNATLQGADLSLADLMHTDLGFADLTGANLIRANLSNANLSGADFTGADLSYVMLSNANLSYVRLSNANLRYANLINADLSYAILIGANLDFSSLPIRCGSLKIQNDKRIACQLLYHTLRAMEGVDDEEVKAILEDKKALSLANQFHRVAECGEIGVEPIKQAIQVEPAGNLQDVCKQENNQL